MNMLLNIRKLVLKVLLTVRVLLTVLEFLYAGSAKLYVRTAFQVYEISCAFDLVLL